MAVVWKPRVCRPRPVTMECRVAESRPVEISSGGSGKGEKGVRQGSLIRRECQNDGNVYLRGKNGMEEECSMEQDGGHPATLSLSSSTLTHP